MLCWSSGNTCPSFTTYALKIYEILSEENVIRPDPDVQQPFVQQLRSPLTLDQLRALQGQEDKCTTLTRMLKNGKLDPVAYSLQEGILYRRVIERGQSFQAIYIPRMPESLIQSILQTAHDESGHNGFPKCIQPSEGCTTGKASKKMYFRTAEIATHVNYTRLLQSSLKLNTSNHH